MASQSSGDNPKLYIQQAHRSAASESAAIIPAYHKYLITLLKIYDLLGRMDTRRKQVPKYQKEYEKVEENN